jgi:pimeloyl-ACP methyl ester carboxylesterase
MPTVTTNDGVEIFYKDWGTGQPIVFSHGWPLSGRHDQRRPAGLHQRDFGSGTLDNAACSITRPCTCCSTESAP